MPEMGCLLLPQGSIGSAGYAALAAAIGDGMVPELRMLDVRENSLGNPGCAALAVVLRTHKNLEALEASISAATVLATRDSLHSCPSPSTESGQS